MITDIINILVALTFSISFAITYCKTKENTYLLFSLVEAVMCGALIVLVIAEAKGIIL